MHALVKIEECPGSLLHSFRYRVNNIYIRHKFCYVYGW